MQNVDTAEKAIADLRQTVATLESDVENLSSHFTTSQSNNDDDNQQQQHDTDARTAKTRTVSELITQALLKVDSIQISKDLAAEALRNGDRDKSRKVAVLLARRKTIVKKLNMLGDKVDQLSTTQQSLNDDDSNDNDKIINNNNNVIDSTTPTTDCTTTSCDSSCPS